MSNLPELKVGMVIETDIKNQVYEIKLVDTDFYDVFRKDDKNKITQRFFRPGTEQLIEEGRWKILAKKKCELCWN